MRTQHNRRRSLDRSIRRAAIVSRGQAATTSDRIDVLSGLAELYDAWHAAEPKSGHDAKAARWRAKLNELQATTQPVTAPK